MATKYRRKRKRLDKEQCKDRTKTNTRLHLLECSEYFTSVSEKHESATTVVTEKHYLNLLLDVYIYLTYLLEFSLKA